MVTSTTTITPLQQQQLIHNNNNLIHSPSSSAGILSEKRSESASTINSAAPSPHSSLNHIKFEPLNSGKTSPDEFEIPKPTPTHVTTTQPSNGLTPLQQQQQQFLQQQQMFANFLPSSIMSTPFYAMGSPRF